MARSLHCVFNRHDCDQLQHCALQPLMQREYNAIINTLQLVSLDSCNILNVVKVLKRAPRVILNSYAKMLYKHTSGHLH